MPIRRCRESLLSRLKTLPWISAQLLHVMVKLYLRDEAHIVPRLVFAEFWERNWLHSLSSPARC